MRRLYIPIGLVLAAALAACDPAPPINTNEVDQTNLQIVDCDANEVCP